VGLLAVCHCEHLGSRVDSHHFHVEPGSNRGGEASRAATDVNGGKRGSLGQVACYYAAIRPCSPVAAHARRRILPPPG
jgi:hypothetical protein